jgi:molybdopterin-guanine dinucleotide biosynthesis protein A
MQQTIAPLNGLVLAGGKSVRMGYDKGAVNWYGKQQRYYMADLLRPFCNKVSLSCRVEQKNEIDPNYAVLEDTFIDLGPYGAILSAFRENPDQALLVIACDLPLMDANTLQYLVANRNPSALATAFQSGFDDFPEPLITIWEPKSYPVLLAWLAQGYSCPRKVLINSDINLLQAPNLDALTNVNTPEDAEKVKQVIQQKPTVNG